MDEWVAWFYVEHFTLQLNKDRGWHLLSPIVLVPVLSRFLSRHRTQPVWLHQNRRDTMLISILVGDALFYLPGKETMSAFHIWLTHFFPRYSRENTNVSQQIDQQFGRYSVPEYLRHRPAYFVKDCVQQIQNAGYPNIGMISEIEKRVFKVSQVLFTRSDFKFRTIRNTLGPAFNEFGYNNFFSQKRILPIDIQC